MKAKSTARSPVPYFGGKARLAERLVALFPPHSTYVEVFAGGASVLFTKAPSTLEVYNDKDSGAVGFFRCLRDRPNELVPLLELTPFARDEWERARSTWYLFDDELERARRWYVAVSQSYSAVTSDAKNNGHGWSGERLGRMHLSRSGAAANRVDHIWRFVERLRLV